MSLVVRSLKAPVCLLWKQIFTVSSLSGSATEPTVQSRDECTHTYVCYRVWLWFDFVQVHRVYGLLIEYTAHVCMGFLDRLCPRGIPAAVFGSKGLYFGSTGLHLAVQGSIWR